MVSIHNIGDSKKPKGMLKTIGEYAHIDSQLPPRNYLQTNATERKKRATRETTDVARVDYEDQPTQKTKEYI